MEVTLLIIATEKQLKLTCYEETKKMAHNSQTVRSKENPWLSIGWPSQRHALGTSTDVRSRSGSSGLTLSGLIKRGFVLNQIQP